MNAKIGAGDHEECESWTGRVKQKGGVRSKKERRTGRNITTIRRKRNFSGNEERRVG